jgi:AraC-like DNA-binding protein/mannose-6-phosphate isomerase-like protein (cupin superfamily)
MRQDEYIYFEDTFQYQIDTNMLSICSVYYDHTEDSVENFDPHVHSYYEIRYCLEGSYTLYIGDGQYNIPNNSLVFIPPLHVHAFSKNNTPRLLQIQVSQAFLSAAALPGNFGAVEPAFCNGYLNVTAPLRGVLQHMMNHSPSANHVHKSVTLKDFTQDQIMLLYGDLYTLIGLMLRDGQLRLNNNPVFKNAASQFSCFQKLIMYILTHPDKEMSLSDAASFTGMSYYYFSKTFHQLMGMSYIDYVNKVRINCSKNLLTQKEMSIKEICTDLNIGSPSYFNRLFKKLTGMSPSEYRKEYSETGPEL